MYAAVAAEEITDPFDNDRKALSSSSKQRHVSQKLRSPITSDYEYKGVELVRLSSTTYSSLPKRSLLPKRRRFWQDTKDELKTVRWRKWATHFYSHIAPLILIISLCLVTTYICVPGVLFQSDDVCRPDGSFYFGPGSYDPWKTQSLFQIDVGFGNFSFANAKLIDFWWDLLVGRGGQILLGFIAYRVCTKALIRHMEAKAVPIETFEAITIQPHTMTGLAKLIIGLPTNRDLHSIATILWFILAAGYVLVFPTFVSAMSGYSARVEAYVEIESGSMIPWDDFSTVRYVIHDGKRLGGRFYDDYPVVLSKPPEAESYYNWGDCENWVGIDELYDDAPETCYFIWNVALYGYESGYLGLNKSASTFNDTGTLIDLEAPTLNITAYFTDYYPASSTYWYNGDYQYLKTGYGWKNPETGNYTFGNVYNPLLLYENKTYSGADMKTLGRCQQTVVQYKWGFSFLLLFSLLVTLIVWCVGTYLTYVDAYLNSQLDPTNRHLGLQRAAMDLASAMEPHVPKDQRDFASNGKIQRLVRGTQVTYSHLLSEPTLSARRANLKAWWKAFQFKQFAKRDKWYFSFTVVVFLLWLASWYPTHRLPPLFANSIMLSSLTLVLYAGPESKARWILFVATFLLYIILTYLTCSRIAWQPMYFHPVKILLKIVSDRGNRY